MSSYTVMQKNGVCFRISGSEDQNSVIAHEMNLGAGLQTLWKLVNGLWLKVYSNV